ncbi:MAG: glycosyltransferase [Veillonellales bacterium]
MDRPFKVLFITAPIGSGHIRAAQAVSRVFRLKYQADVQIVNVFDFFSPWLGNTILKMYLKLLAVFPQIYGRMYQWGNDGSLALFGREVISYFLARRMKHFISACNPAVIVCTHATPAGLVARLLHRQEIHIPSVAIITDFVVHRLWVYPELDYYFVARSKMQEYLQQYGIGPAKSQTTGIPVDLVFGQPFDRQQMEEKLQFAHNIKTILIMGGGAGMLPIDEIIALCDTLDIPLQIIAVTGNNTKMYEKLRRIPLAPQHHLRIEGFVDNVHEFMAAADVLISKPGGMSSAEALSRGLPMLIYHPIPGQEQANTQYLLEQKAALRADSLSELKSLLIDLLVQHPERLIFLKQQALGLGHPAAAEVIADRIYSDFFSG